MASDVTNASVRLLTGGDIAIGGYAGSIRGQAQRSLFILLALSSGQPVSRDKIAATLWPDADPTAGRANLRAALLALRRSLDSVGGPKLDANNETITLIDAEVDLDEFARLTESRAPEDWRRALHLYQGDLCPDPHMQSEEFNSRLQIEQEKWRSAAIKVAERLVERIDPAENPDEAVAAANALMKIDPAHEPTARLLMRVFNEKGDRGMALRQFEQFRTALLDRYDLQPSEETWALRDEIAQSGTQHVSHDDQAPETEAAITPKRRSRGEPRLTLRLSPRSIGVAVGSALVAIAGAYLLLGDGPSDEPAAAPVLAVEPFNYDEGDSDVNDFVESLRTELLIDLASEGGALVTITESPAPLSPDATSEFHLRGSVQRFGASVKVTSQLVSIRDQVVIWANAEVVGLDTAEATSELTARQALLALREARDK